ncbi:MAG: FHA domain-containing protein [Pseudomonadota bacterium]|nr:FHA domain-containing protein [Pseudomonadota bacterium]
MDVLKLRFPGQARAELPLGVGMHGIGRGADGELSPQPLEDGAEPPVRFCVDRRGVWLTVAEGVQGVHVNGRHVRRMAMLRVGDAIYVDGVELRLMSDRVPAAPSSLDAQHGQDAHDDPRVVLRGVGGQYHGRSFTLERPRLVGSTAEADIRIDDPAFAQHHARIELLGEQVVLHDLGSAEGSMVNGEPVHDAVLQSGDQVVFDAHHRFVVEAPARALVVGESERTDAEASLGQAHEDDIGSKSPARSRTLPWLLLAAVLLAALLSALMLYGTG